MAAALEGSGKDLTEAGRVSLSKAFLRGISASRGVEGKFSPDFSLYYEYRNQLTMVDDQLNFSALSRFGDASEELVYRLQFRGESPAEEPHHFSFFSSEDLGRLASHLDIVVVVYLYENSRKPATPVRLPNGDAFWMELLENFPSERRHFFLFHDYRLLEEEQTRTKPVYSFVLTSKLPRSLYLVGRPDLLLPSLDAFSHAWFSLSPGTAYLTCCRFRQNCYAGVDAVVVGRDETSAESYGDNAHVLTLEDLLCADRSRLYSRWSRLYARERGTSSPRCFIVVLFVRMAGKNLKGPRVAKKFVFVTAAVASASSAPGETRDLAAHVSDDAFVVCLFGKRYACRVREDIRVRVIQMHRQAKSAKEVLQNRSNLSGVPRTLPPEEFAAAVEEADRQKKEKSSGKKHLPEFICKCEDCLSTPYIENMGKNGPDRLCSLPYSLSDLLRLLGLFTAETETLVERLCELSLAAMDIESQTIATSNRGPFPGPRVSYEEFGGPTYEGHVVHTQRPIMLGHTDCLSHEANFKWIDQVANDSVSAVYDLFARYWLHVTACRKAATAEKRRLSISLTETVAKYRAAHAAYTTFWSENSRLERDVMLQEELAVLQCQKPYFDADTFDALLANLQSRYYESEEWTMPDECSKKMAAAFRNMLPGQLETQLLKLQHRYVVFSFYG